MTLTARLVAYLPGTDIRLRHLPEPLSWEASFPHNDVSALRLTYSGLALGGDAFARTLEQGVDLSVQVNTGSGWYEPDNGRFLLVRRDLNPADRSETQTLTAPGYGWLLGKATASALEMLEAGGEFAGQRLFAAANPGLIMRTLLDEYYARHAHPKPAFGWDFTSGLDSAMVAWPVWTPARAVPYPPEKTLAEILAGLVSMGWCDWRFRARTLDLWVPDTQFVNRAADVKLRLGVDVGDAPSTETIEDAAGYTLAFGEGSVVTSIRDAAAPSAWGVWEAVSKVGGATTVADVESAVAGEVAYRARAAGQYTRTLILDGAQVLPWRDYVPGDVVSAPASTAELVPMRVQQVTLARDAQGNLGGSVVLNDRMVPGDLRVARRLSMLTGGSPNASNRLPIVAPRPIPKAPTGVELSTNAWWNYGVSRATVGVIWAPVTESTAGRPIVIASYRVRVAPVGFEGSAQSVSATIDDLPTGVTVQVQVAAVSDLGVQGAWSSVAEISTAVPPNTLVPPTALILTTGDGVVRTQWDGKMQAPPDPPVDPPGHFSRIVVQSALSEDGPWVTQGSIDTIGGRWVIPGDPGQTIHVRGIAVDRAGNQTGPGPVSSIVVSSWVHDAVQAAQDAADDAMAAAAAAQTTADGKNAVRASVSEPAAPPGGWAQGDLWYVKHASENRVTGVRVWNGTSFVPYTLVADSVLVPGSLGTISLADDAVTAPKLFVNAATINKLAVDDLWTGKIKGAWLQVDAAMINALTVNGSLWASKIKAPWLDVDQAMIDRLFVSSDLWAGKISTSMMQISADDMMPWNPVVGIAPHVAASGTLAVYDSQWHGRGLYSAGTGGYADGTYAQAVRFCSGRTARNGRTEEFDVDAGETYALQLRWGIAGTMPAGVTRGVNLQVVAYDGTGALVGSYGATAQGPGAYETLSTLNWSWTAPAGAVSARVFMQRNWHSTGGVYIAAMSMKVAAGGRLIVDGAIDGKVITGATVRTAATGQRLALTTDLRGYDSANRQSMLLNSNSLQLGEYYAGTGMATLALDYSGLTITHPGTWGSMRALFYDGTLLIGKGDLTTSNQSKLGVISLFADIIEIGNPATTTSSANLFLSGTTVRTLLRSTSLRRYKVLVHDLPEVAGDLLPAGRDAKTQNATGPDGTFLSLQPHSWYDRGEVERAKLHPETVTEADCQAAGLRRIPGFIAEEVEAIDPLYCVYNTAGELEGIAYDRLAVAIHATLTDLATRVEALETR